MRPGMLDYACAKAGGMLSRSWRGEKLRSLVLKAKLDDIARELFPGQTIVLPGKLLARELQARFDAVILEECVRIVGSLSNPPRLFVEFLLGWERDYLRSCMIASSTSAAPMPPPPNLGPWTTIRTEAWPDVRAMFARGPHAPYLDLHERGGFAAFDAALGAAHYEALLAAASALESRSPARALVREEAALRNAAWALRMRVNYRLRAEEAEAYLVGGEEERGEARRCFAFPLDDPSPWRGWRYAPYLGGGEGAVDPGAFERTAAIRLRAKEESLFPAGGVTLDRIWAFLKLKDREAQAVRSLIEGIPLGVTGDAMLHFLGVGR